MIETALKSFVDLSKSDIEEMNLGHLQSYRIIQKILRQGFGYLYHGKLEVEKREKHDYYTGELLYCIEPDDTLYFSDITDFTLDELCGYFQLSGLYRLKYEWLLKMYRGEIQDKQFPNWKIISYSVNNKYEGPVYEKL